MENHGAARAGEQHGHGVMAVNRPEQNVMQNMHPAFGEICTDRILHLPF
jgi:hypothetical protein